MSWKSTLKAADWWKFSFPILAICASKIQWEFFFFFDFHNLFFLVLFPHRSWPFNCHLSLNANMADHSVGPRWGFMKARLIRPRWFAMHSQKSLISSSISVLCYISPSLRVFVSLNASRRNKNLPTFASKRKSGSGNHHYRQRSEALCTISLDGHWSVANREP